MFDIFKSKKNKAKAEAPESILDEDIISQEERIYTLEEHAKMEAYKAKYVEESTPGWDAIDNRLASFYQGREPDLHMATLIKYMLGGPDPLDGVSAYIRYDPVPHIHYISYGMTSLYRDEFSAITEFNGWGFELTFRLMLNPNNLPKKRDEVPIWPVSLMQNYARYVCDTGNTFLNGQYLNAQSSLNADKPELNIHGNIFITDPELGHIETVHGKMEFLQIIGATKEEIHGLMQKSFVGLELSNTLKRENPLLVTNMDRVENMMIRNI